MPSPVPPSIFKGYIPGVNSALCGKFIPNIINFMRSYSEFYSYMFDPVADDGTFNQDFIDDLCAVQCFCNDSTCPEITITLTNTGQDGHIILSYACDGMTAPGYDYKIYRAVTYPPVSWGAALVTGVTTGSTITYDDATAVNGTTYFYKLTVQKAGCDEYSHVSNGLSTIACWLKNVGVQAVANPDRSIDVTVSAFNVSIPVGTLLKIYRSVLASAIGDEIVNTTFAAGTYTLNDVNLNAGTMYYYTAIVQQDDGGAPTNCSEITVKASAMAQSSAKLATPQLSANGKLLNWPCVANATTHEAYAVTPYPIAPVSSLTGSRVVIDGIEFPGIDIRTRIAILSTSPCKVGVNLETLPWYLLTKDFSGAPPGSVFLVPLQKRYSIRIRAISSSGAYQPSDWATYYLTEDKWVGPLSADYQSAWVAAQ